MARLLFARASAVLSSHPGTVLFVCALLFGMGYGLGHERELVPMPSWCSESRYRFCLALMAWTALIQRTPVQMLAWSITDFVVLSLPFLAGIVFAPDMEFRSLVAYEIAVGKLAAGGLLGVCVSQAVLSLFPERNKSTAEGIPV